MYDSTLGRFLQRDPTGFREGDSNLYRYVRDQPTSATDPNGLEILTAEQYRRGAEGIKVTPPPPTQRRLIDVGYKPGHIPGVVGHAWQLQESVNYFLFPGGNGPYLWTGWRDVQGEMEWEDPNPKPNESCKYVFTNCLRYTYLVETGKNYPGFLSAGIPGVDPRSFSLGAMFDVVVGTGGKDSPALRFPDVPLFRQTGDFIPKVTRENAPRIAEWLRISQELARKGVAKGFEQKITESLACFENMARQLGWSTKLP